MRCLNSSSGAGKGVKFLLPLPFVLLRPSKDWMKHTKVGMATYFTQSTDSNINHVHEHPHRLTQNLCLTWAAHGCQVDIKLIITSWYFLLLLFLKSQETSLSKCFLSIGFFLSCRGAAFKSILVESKFESKFKSKITTLQLASFNSYLRHRKSCWRKSALS